MGQMTELQVGKIEGPEAREAPRRRSPLMGNGKAMKPWKKYAFIAAGAIVLLGLIFGGIAWSKRGVVTVQTGKVVRQNLTALVTASGQIKPPSENFASVNANSFGKITEILVKEGDHVKKGQLLMRTEDVQQSADVQAQEAALKTQLADASASEAAVQSAAANLKTAQADLVQAQAKYEQAKNDFARTQELYKEKLIAKQVFDQGRSDYEVAEAAVQSAQARVAQAKAQSQQSVYNRDMSGARVAQSRAQLVRFTDVRNKTIYTAPFDGVITSLPVHEGENVVPGIQNSVGSQLFEVSDLSIITAEVKVDETDIINVKLGQPAEVQIDAIPNKSFKGHVTEIGQSAVSRSTGQTTTSSSSTATEEAKDFKVVVTLDNPPDGLRPGLSATAKITTATRENAVSVPIQALTIRTEAELEAAKKKDTKGAAVAAANPNSGQPGKDKAKEELQGVFVIKNGRAEFQAVETGIMGVTDIEVTKGLQAGEEIVTGSYQVLRTLKPDTKVKVDNTHGGPGDKSGPAPS